MHTQADSEKYLKGASGALRKIFETFVEYRAALSKQQEKIDQLNQQKQNEYGHFKDWGQWQDSANAYHVNMLHRMQVANTIITEVERQEREYRIRKDLTEDTLLILGGSVLQFGKQVVSYRFGERSNIPIGIRNIGSQEIGFVIWEGRNNALHWEEQNPKDNQKAIFKQLAADYPQKGFDVLKNNSLRVLDVLEWKESDDVIQDLLRIIR